MTDGQIEVKVKEGSIQINDKYILRYDNIGNKWLEQAILIKKEDSKNKGAIRYKRVTFYNQTYQELLRDVADRAISGAEAKNLEELVQVIADVEKFIRELARDIGKALDNKNA